MTPIPAVPRILEALPWPTLPRSLPKPLLLLHLPRHIARPKHPQDWASQTHLPRCPSPETTSASLGPTVWQLPMAPAGRRALGDRRDLDSSWKPAPSPLPHSGRPPRPAYPTTPSGASPAPLCGCRPHRKCGCGGRGRHRRERQQPAGASAVNILYYRQVGFAGPSPKAPQEGVPRLPWGAPITTSLPCFTSQHPT